MSGKEISVRCKKAGEPALRLLPATGIKIDQDIPAEDQIELSGKRIRWFIQIQAKELDE